MGQSIKNKNSLVVDIFISADEYLRHYQGSVTTVACTARDGRRIRFPSRILQPYVSKEGVKGTFAIQFDEYHKFVGIEQLN